MTGRASAPFRLGDRLNTTAKVLVALSCLAIFGSLIDMAVNPTPKPERRKPETSLEILERYSKLREEREVSEMGPRPKPYIWQQRLERAKDYASLVEIALPAANAGNADAQFTLYGAFSYCRDGLRKRTPDEMAQFPEIMLRDMHAHCDDLAAQYPDLATEAEIWLTKSLESKFPRALAFTALEEVRALTRKPPKKNERDRRVQVARENLLLALKSNDPSITKDVPEFLPVLFPDSPQVPRAQWVWRLAACEQGLDCGPKAEMMLRDCRMHDRCIEGETAIDYIRRASGDFSSLMSRARNLARQLRKSQLDAQVFDETVTSLAK